MSEYLTIDKEEALRLVAQCGSNLALLPPELTADKDIVRAAVISDSSAIQFASPLMRDDDDIAFIAIDDEPLTFQYLSERLKNDKLMCLTAVQNDPVVFVLLPDSVKTESVIFNHIIEEYAQGKISKESTTAFHIVQSLEKIKEEAQNKFKTGNLDISLEQIANKDNPHLAVEVLAACSKVAEKNIYYNPNTQQLNKNNSLYQEIESPTLSL